MNGPVESQMPGIVVAQAGHGETGDTHDAHAAEGAAHAAGEGHETALDGAHGAAAGGHEAEGYLMPHELPNFATWIEGIVNPKFTIDHGHRPHPSSNIPLAENGPAWLNIPINPIFSILYAIMIVLVIRRGLKSVSLRRPGKLQNFVEMVLGGLHKFFHGVLGDQGKQYIPFAGSLFLFIFVNNIMCLVPMFKAPTSSLATTAGLGALTFCYVHYNVIRQAGFVSWIKHLWGEPAWMGPFNFPLHVLGELIKPVSLSARLFGNILGEDKLLAAFLGMGMLIVATISHNPTPIVGVPLQLPFFFLVVLGSTIQALVFSLLASIYIVLLLPHDDRHEHEDARGAEAHGGGIAPRAAAAKR
jgi:F-type H+-transporting ATPase subunit a